MSTPPKWPIALLPDIATKTLELAYEFRADLDPRLQPGVIETLTTKLGELEGKRTAAVVAPTALKAATLNQNDTAAVGYQLVTGGRRAIARVGTKADAKAFGVGEKMRKDSVPQVLGGIAKFLSGATARPEIARAAGILPADLEAARTIQVQLDGADKTQGQLKAKKPSATAARNGAAKDIAVHVDAILAAADIAFYARPEVLARFRAVVPAKKAKKAKNPPKE